MSDLENRSGILFAALFVLTIVIGVLGTSVLIRLSRSGGIETPLSGCGPGPALVTFVLMILAFMSTFLPYLSVLPALIFFVLGVRALAGGRGLPREGGAVMLLVGLGWVLYTAFEVAMAAWERTVMGPIRADIVVAVPVMGVISFIGLRVQSSLAAMR